MTGSSSDNPRKRRKSRSRRDRRMKRRWWLWAVSLAAALVVFCVVWVGTRAWIAKGDLEAIVPLSSELKSAALANEPAKVSKLASALHQHAESAGSLTSDPIWRAAELTPVLGTNLTAVREISAVARDLSRNAVGPLTKLIASVKVENFKPVDGAVNLAPLIDAQPSVSTAAGALQKATKDVANIPVEGTVAPVRNAVDRLDAQLSELAPPIEALSNAVSLAPAMLGEDAPRNYLLIFQNPAELRSTGGIPGAMALIHTDSGKIELTRQSSSSEFPRYASPVLEVPTDTRGLYGDIIGQFVQDINLTPSFDLTARLAQKMWMERYGETVDGVISLDPVALSYLLSATGPVLTATGDSIDESNAVQLLLNEAYIRYAEPKAQDAFFAAAAKAVFDKLSSGDLDTTRLIAALARAGDERRLLVWNANPDESSILEGSTLSGQLPGEYERSPKAGIYLNDATGAKMDYYQDVQTGIGSASCRKDGKPYVAISVTLVNRAPADAANALPPYITGNGVFGVTPGNIRTMISAYGSPGMVNLGVSQDGNAVPAHSATDAGRPVTQISAELAPGQSVTYLFGFLADGEGFGASDLQTTPTINMNETSELALTCESALW